VPGSILDQSVNQPGGGSETEIGDLQVLRCRELDGHAHGEQSKRPQRSALRQDRVRENGQYEYREFPDQCPPCSRDGA
jgi:hypothetical protein